MSAGRIHTQHWRERASPFLRGYGTAVLCALAGTLLRMAVHSVWGDRQPFTFYYPAVLLSALYGGIGPGILCMILSGLAALYFFFPANGALVLTSPSISSGLLAYLFVAGILIFIGQRQRCTRRRAETHILEIEQKELRIRENEEHLRAIVDQAVVGIGESDLQGHIEMVNDRFCEIVGRTREELIGMTVPEITHPEDRLLNARLFQELASTGRGYNYEKRYIRPDGSAVWVHNNVSPLRGADGRIYGTVAIVQDISARKHQEEEMHRLNTALKMARDEAVKASQVKSSFLATMSHEIRTPLNAVIGFAELVEEELHEIGQDHMADDVEKIRVSGNHLLTIISDILDLSKIEAGKMELKPEEFRVDQVVREAVDLVMPLMEMNGNGIRTDCDSGVGLVYADRTRFRQVLFNLLSNAAKFTEHGTIRVTCRRDSSADGKGWITLSVSDTGVGMSGEQLSQLFQKFQQLDSSSTRRHGGTGLGLAISQLLCRMMGGEISVDSEVGKGSTFTVRLPATASPVAVPAPPPRARGVAAAGGE